MKIRYAHTNIVARDWKKLAKFYIEVMQCKIKPPERDLKGEWLERVTALPGAHITGIHLYLPGYEENGPTLEIFQYGKIAANDNKKPNTEGFGHIAFTVDSVEECVAEIKAHGGGLAGEIIKTEISGAGTICFAYAHDPEGNIIEIQKWG
jgi:predicted enzyme related to lactoylglutathione lyase